MAAAPRGSEGRAARCREPCGRCFRAQPRGGVLVTHKRSLNSKASVRLVGGCPGPKFWSLIRITQSALEIRFLTAINHDLFFFSLKSKLLCHPSSTETVTKEEPEEGVWLKTVPQIKDEIRCRQRLTDPPNTAASVPLRDTQAGFGYRWLGVNVHE